jgi:hypothetical protein
MWRALNRSPALKSQKSHCHSSFLQNKSLLGKLAHQELNYRTCSQLSAFIEIAKIAPRHSFVLFILFVQTRIQLQGMYSTVCLNRRSLAAPFLYPIYISSLGKPFPRVLSPNLPQNSKPAPEREAVKSTLVHRYTVFEFYKEKP